MNDFQKALQAAKFQLCCSLVKWVYSQNVEAITFVTY